MTQSSVWKRSLEAFFDDRAAQIDGTPTLEDLCHVAGRDPRLWRDEALFEDMVASIVELAVIDPSSRVLEVGCAAGFIARGVAPRAGTYVGVDLAREPLRLAKRLRLPNASFRLADAVDLPFPADSFDVVLCYDVFTNLPSFADGEAMLKEMVRVVKPGGRVLVGSIPDRDTEQAFVARSAQVAAELSERYGPVAQRGPSRGGATLWNRIFKRRRAADPHIVCYYFGKEDFDAFGRRHALATTISDIHPMNPYRGYRFNVVFRKIAA